MLKNIGKEIFTLLLGGVLIGVLMSCLANGFVYLVKTAAELRSSSNSLIITLGAETYSLLSILTLTLAATFILIIKKFFDIDAWKGPADTIYVAHSETESSQTKQGIGSTLAALIVASGGGSVGQYGPLVHLGSTIALTFRERFKIGSDTLIGCGVAAAISAGFGAPIAGVLFSHEAILRHFSIRAIAPIFISSFTASAFGTLAFGPVGELFQVSSAPIPLSNLLILFLLLGPIFSGVALVFMRLIRLTAQYASKDKEKHNYFLFSAAIICGSVGVIYPEILGIGTDAMGSMIAGDVASERLLMLLVLKICMTALCLGCGLFGGVFSPALFIGIASGAVAASIATAFGFQGYGQTIMIAGMAAVSSCVIGAPITSIILVLELTGSYEHAISAMVAVIVANLISYRVFGLSYFDRQLMDRGIDIKAGREVIALKHESIMSCEAANYTQILNTTSGQDTYNKMLGDGHTEAYVIDHAGFFLGKVDIFDAQRAKEDNIGSHVQTRYTFLTENETIQKGIENLSNFVGESIPIVSEDKRHLRLVITESSLFKKVLEIQGHVREIEKS